MANAADLNFTSMNGGNTWMGIKASGNVGIGTTSPATTLDINGGLATRVTNATLSTTNLLLVSAAAMPTTSYVLLTSTIPTTPGNAIFYLPAGSNGQRLTIELNQTNSGTQGVAELISGYPGALAPSGAVSVMLNTATYTLTNPFATIELIYDAANTTWVQTGGSASLATNINKTSYTSAGSYTWTCPTGISQVFVKMWGAGGGGSAHASGGGAGYVSGNLYVAAGTQYTITVGGGGNYGSGSGSGGTNGGGAGGSSSTGGAGGGGRSSIVNVTSGLEIATAGGGGGAGGFNASCNGGVGGSGTGGTGAATTAGYGGVGGTSAPGGSGGSAGASGTRGTGGGSATATGGTANENGGVGGGSVTYSGGGGGGGYYGGGGGSGSATNQCGGGGGGASYCPTANFNGAPTNTIGSGTGPGYTDSDCTTCGKGGGTTSNGTAGTVVILW
jgi:hypothetical protein